MGRFRSRTDGLALVAGVVACEILALTVADDRAAGRVYNVAEPAAEIYRGRTAAR